MRDIWDAHQIITSIHSQSYILPESVKGNRFWLFFFAALKKNYRLVALEAAKFPPAG